MSMFTLAISCLTTSNLPTHGPNIPGSYAILLFIALDFTSITSHIHNWVLFFLWLHPIILSEVISPLISSSILGTYRPRELIFQYPIILPFHTVHGVLKARILKWFAIPFSSGPHCLLIQCPPLEKQGLYGLWSHDINVVGLEKYFRNFYFEIIRETQEVEKIVQRGPMCPSFSLCRGNVLSSLAPPQTQKINIGIIHSLL